MFFFVSLAFSKLYTTVAEEKAFLSWMRNTNNIYTGDEYHLRFGIYLANKNYINQYNRKSNTFKLTLNKLACHTPSEYKSLLGIRTPFTLQGRKVSPKNKIKDVPDNFDYRDLGYVNGVRDQLSCGACWAFSAISVQEMTDVINTGNLISLSECNLIDCANIECQGCNGGWADKALLYVIQQQNGTFCSEMDYNYRPWKEVCQFKYKENHYSHISDVQFVPRDEENMKIHIATVGALSVAVDASQASFQLYDSGVYDEPKCTKGIYNHAMNIVGYGVDADSGKDYWIVRNSWGTSWGEAGYIRFFRGADTCNIADAACYSIY